MENLLKKIQLLTCSFRAPIEVDIAVHNFVDFKVDVLAHPTIRAISLLSN